MKSDKPKNPDSPPKALTKEQKDRLKAAVAESRKKADLIPKGTFKEI